MHTEPLSIQLLHPSTLNPRKHFDQKGLEELAESLKEKHFLHALIVRPSPKEEGHYEIVCGERRFRAAQLAGLTEVPADIRPYDDKAALECMVIENLQRENVHPTEEAAAYEQLRTEHNYDVAGIAARTGKSKTYVYGRLHLLQLVPEVSEAYRSEKITASHAELIGRLPVNLQLQALNHAWQEWKGTACRVSELKDYISREFHRILEHAPFSRLDEDLLPGVGSCNQCPKRSGAAPQLFEDLGRKDICTDSACYEKKVDANFKAQRKKLKAETPDFVQISTKHYSSKPDVLAQDHFSKAKPSTDGAVAALVTDGPEKGKVVHVVVNDAGKKHQKKKPSSSAPSTQSWEVEREKNAKLAPIRTKARELATKQILESMKFSGEETLTKALFALLDERAQPPAKIKTLRDAVLHAVEDELQQKWVVQASEHDRQDFARPTTNMAEIFKVDLDKVLKTAKAELASKAENSEAEAEGTGSAATKQSIKKKTAAKKAAKTSPAKKAAKKAVKK